MKPQTIVCALLVAVLPGCSWKSPGKRTEAAKESSPAKASDYPVVADSASLPAEANGQALVIRTKGEPQWVVGETTGLLKPRTVVREGTSVRTPAKSTAELNIGRNGGTIQLEPDSEVEFARLRYAEDSTAETRVSVVKGMVSLSVVPLGDASRYEIELPDGFVRTRSAKLRVKVTDQSEIWVTEGCVDTEWVSARATDSKRINVCAGQRLVLGEELPSPFDPSVSKTRSSKSTPPPPTSPRLKEPLLYHQPGPR